MECHYNGKTFFIPTEMMSRVLLGVEVEKRRFVRYKTGAYLFNTSERVFNQLANDADAVYKYYGCALVDPDEVEAHVRTMKVSGLR